MNLCLNIVNARGRSIELKEKRIKAVAALILCVWT